MFSPDVGADHPGFPLLAICKRRVLRARSVLFATAVDRVSAPSAGLFRRALVSATVSAAVSAGVFLLLRTPGTRESLALPPALATDTAAAVLSLLLGTAAGALIAALLFREPDRAAGLALAALQGDGSPADDSEAGAPGGRDLGLVATRLAEWRQRARQADLAHRRLSETLTRLARRIEEMPFDQFRPIPTEGNPEEAERSLVRAVNGLLESAQRSRNTAAVLLSRIEEDLEQAVEPLDEADRRMTAGSAALDRSLVTMSRALALVARAAELDSRDAAREELDPARERLKEAVRESYEARFSLEQCLTAMGRARSAGGHVEREVAAVRKRFGGADVKVLSDTDLVPENGVEPTGSEDTQ